jgi:hypothetical protein
LAGRIGGVYFDVATVAPSPCVWLSRALANGKEKCFRRTVVAVTIAT